MKAQTILRTGILFVLVLVLAATSTAMIGSEVAEVDSIPSELTEPAACLVQDDAGPALPFDLGTQSWGGFPSCVVIHGTYCPVPGAIARCQWTPYEPEICVCQANNTFACF